MASLRVRTAGQDDVEAIANLHTDSWRRHYRGAYTDAYLDGDVVADRREVWGARLASADGTATILAEDGAELAGFVHVVLDNDDHWGSLIDNLHVVYHRKRSGIGRTLIEAATRAVIERATRPDIYLWVLEQNTAAQRFYRAIGGIEVERGSVPSPGGVPGRLNGNPGMIRIAWSGPAVIDISGG